MGDWDVSVPLVNGGLKRVKRDERLIAKNLKAHYEFIEKPVADGMTKEQLDHLHKCIRYTQLNLHEESMAKMDEEIPSVGMPFGLPKDI